MKFSLLVHVFLGIHGAISVLAESQTSGMVNGQLPETDEDTNDKISDNDENDALTTNTFGSTSTIPAKDAVPTGSAAVHLPKGGNLLQELLRSSVIFGHVQQELESLAKQLTGIKNAMERFEANLKEDMAAIQEDIQSLKTTSVELETDVQTSSDAMERIADWTNGLDARMTTLERAIQSACKSRKRHDHQPEERKNVHQGKVTKKQKPLKAARRKMVEDDFLHEPQADEGVVNTAVSGQVGFAVPAIKECAQDIKVEMQKMQKQCLDICKPRPTSCADVQRFGATKNGSYTINPWMAGFDSFVTVDCDLQSDGGGWTIIQRRGDFGHPKVNFMRNWTDYKIGFGDVRQEFWLGNDIIYALTNQEPVVLKVELESFDNESSFAEYAHFRLDSESNKYKLSLGAYSGNAADSLGRSRGMNFSTQDSDNDNWTGNCAKRFKGGWWFNNCHDAHLNGFYYQGPHESYADGINWYHWKGFHYSLRRSELKIRPKWLHDRIRDAS